MEYQVTDLSIKIGQHDIVIRGLECDSEEHGDQCYISCSTCFKITDYNPNGKVQDSDMELMYMEAHLHADGFDTGWDTGGLEDLN